METLAILAAAAILSGIVLVAWACLRVGAGVGVGAEAGTEAEVDATMSGRQQERERVIE